MATLIPLATAGHRLILEVWASNVNPSTEWRGSKKPKSSTPSTPIAKRRWKIIKGTWMSKRSKDERDNKEEKVPPTIAPPKSLVVVTAKNKK